MHADARQHAESLCQAGARFYQRGWCVATSSNFSVVLSRSPTRLLVTASGKHKGTLTVADFLQVGADGQAIDDPRRPSAEVALHTMLARRPDVGAILHIHSVWDTLLSDQFAAEGGLSIDGYEMLKAFEGVTTHDHREWVPVYPNSQDILTLAAHIATELPESVHGFLLARHGLYTWGRDLEAAVRHIEAFEFLFEVFWRRLTGSRG